MTIVAVPCELPGALPKWLFWILQEEKMKYAGLVFRGPQAIYIYKDERSTLPDSNRMTREEYDASVLGGSLNVLFWLRRVGADEALIRMWTDAGGDS